MNLWDGDGLLLLNILHNNQLKELGDTSNNAMVTLPVHVIPGVKIFKSRLTRN